VPAERYEGGWHHLSPDDTGVYGAAIDNAHAAARGMRQSRRPVTVALIGYGIDVEHEAIENAIWVNPRAGRSGRRDMHGWNFLGNDTVTLDRISREGDREYFRLRDRYDHYVILTGDGKAYGVDPVTGAPVELEIPADREELDYFFNTVLPESVTAELYRALPLSRLVVWLMRDADRRMREQFPDRQLTVQDFRALFRNPEQVTPFEKRLFVFADLMVSITGSESWDDVLRYMDMTFMPFQEREYQRGLRIGPPRDRELIGDDPYDLDDRDYGSPNLMAENAGFGSMLAGIIGADRRGGRMRGISDNVRIMTLRVDAGERDESYTKDVALAIRYAVDNGAQIIQLGKTNTLYPRPHSQWVDDALRYAESKGVLVVIPMMDYSYDLDIQPFYPRRHTRDGRELTNVITVAASDSLGNSYKWANFSATQLDIFAPGVEILSSHTDGRYAFASGSAFAAAVVTGTAALIKDYYPWITPAQMRKLLMDNVTPRGDAEVEKQFYFYAEGQAPRIITDLFLFSELSASGGILNAERAFKAAASLRRQQ